LIFIILAFLLFSCDSSGGGGSGGQASSVRFIVNTPTYRSEAEYVFNQIQQTVFFDSFGSAYDLNLPNVPLINSLKDRVRAGGTLNLNDWDQLITLFRNDIFNLADYDRAIVAMNNAARIAEQHAYRFVRYNRRWGFFLPPEFNIHISLYGPGGSYNPFTAEMSVRVRDNNIPTLLDVILHEAVHIGIEQNIIMRYNVSQNMKERIVDHFTVHLFDDILPNYRLQSMGDPSIDVIFREPDVFDHLPTRVRDYLRDGQAGLDYSEAVNIARAQATVSTPTPLEGLWINRANWAFAFAFQGNGFSRVMDGSPELSGTFTLSSGNINFSDQWGRNWSQPYTLSGGQLVIDMPSGSVNVPPLFGTFTRQ